MVREGILHGDLTRDEGRRLESFVRLYVGRGAALLIAQKPELRRLPAVLALFPLFFRFNYNFPRRDLLLSLSNVFIIIISSGGISSSTNSGGMLVCDARIDLHGFNLLFDVVGDGG